MMNAECKMKNLRRKSRNAERLKCGPSEVCCALHGVKRG